MGQDEASRPSRATESSRACASPRFTASRAHSRSTTRLSGCNAAISPAIRRAWASLSGPASRSSSLTRANRAFRSPGESSTARRRCAIASANCPRTTLEQAEQSFDRAALGRQASSLLQVLRRAVKVSEPEVQETPVGPSGGLKGDQLRRTRQGRFRTLVRVDVKGGDTREERRDHSLVGLGAGLRQLICDRLWSSPPWPSREYADDTGADKEYREGQSHLIA